jgi:proline iminopeptidase
MSEHLLDTPSARLRLRVQGQGPPMALLHGGPGTYDYLSDSALGDYLARTHTVIGFDQRGCRRSPSSGPFTVDANLGDIEAIRAFMDIERFLLLGHSWGGLLSVFYAAAYPDRVAGLVLIGAIGAHSGWEREFQRTIDRRHTASQRDRLAEIDADIARTRDPTAREELYRHRFNAALPSYLARSHRHQSIEIVSFSRRVSVVTMADVQRSRYAKGQWQSGLAELHCPITLLHGLEDPVPCRVVREIQHLLPQARAIYLPDCGHFPWLEIPDRFHRALAAALDG